MKILNAIFLSSCLIAVKCINIYSDPNGCGAEFGDTPAHKNPWLVSVYLADEGNNFLCSGSLISSIYMVTAASCFDGIKDLANITVRLGDTFAGPCTEDCSANAVEIPVKKVYVPQQYDGSEYNIAVVVFSKQVEFTEYISPICLPSGNETVHGKTLLAAGFSKTDVQTCSKLEKTTYKEIDGKTGNKCTDVSACNGNRGGPVMIKTDELGFVLFGVSTAQNTVCWNEGTVGEYSNVIQHLEFILRATKATRLQLTE